jgi:exodeoxyribonuclease-3
MKLISWNVNGIRAAVQKGFIEQIMRLDADIICLQEIKADAQQTTHALSQLKGYEIHVESAQKKGYSGVAILSKKPLLSVKPNMGIAEHDLEGRMLTADLGKYFLVNVYTPNSGEGLKRLNYRTQWDIDFRKFVVQLEKVKPVIIGGDLNVAHREIDIARPKSNYNKSAGYTQVEIDGISHLMAEGYVDTFRYLNPETVQYSWWSYRMNAREKNIGWRIDYFLLSHQSIGALSGASIHTEVTGSDHCPISLVLL